MNLKKIYLIDFHQPLIDAWNEVFHDDETFEIIDGDFFSVKADAMVSPANSFGIMDGGLDLAIRNELGFDVEKKLQQVIIDKYHGELPVGCAEIIKTNHNKWPYMISAPTMRVPQDISYTFNAYIAFRAILIAIKNHNQKNSTKIESIVCPGLGTGIGSLDPRKCAAQMKVAFSYLSKPPKIPSFDEIHRVHQSMLRAN